MTKRDELIALDPAGLEAAVRECARITAPEISDVEYERIKADNSPRYQNTRAEMERTLRAYLNAARSDAPDIGRWLSAALDDPTVCAEMKADISAWFAAGQPNVQPALEAPAAGDGEPVAWSKVTSPPTVGGTYIVGGYIDDGTLPRHFERDFALFRQTDDGPEWSLSGKRNIPIEYWHDIPAHPEHRDAIVTAQPADARMREALERIQAACNDPVSYGRSYLTDKIAHTAYVALTAPGATTVPTLVDDPNSASGKRVEYQRPSDPSSTRSEVTGELQVRSIIAGLRHAASSRSDRLQQIAAIDIAIGYLETHEIRRKK